MVNIAAIILLLLGNTVHAFVPAQQRSAAMTAVQPLRASLPNPEESARVLTEYMAKAHEEKLKAVKAAEEKKQAEIEALKAQVDELKSQRGSGALVTVEAPAGSIEELQQKLISYQNFMAKYIVEAQEAKIRAIADAQLATAKKYEAIMLSATATLPPSAKSPLPGAADPTTSRVISERNTKVFAAAAAGKSRWGDAEIQRLTTGIVSPPQAQAVPAAVPAAPVTPLSAVPPQVAEADHGLRNDGGVGGLTLAERVVGGANAVPPAAVAGTSPTQFLFHQRNQKLAQMGNKSRWGSMEVAKASSMAASFSPSTVAPEVVEKADHGLRADGGVGGPTLADRVNLGAQLLGVK